MGLLQNAMEHLDDAVLITDAAGIIEYANPAAVSKYGHPLPYILGKKPSIFKSGLHDASFYEHLWRTIKAGRKWKGSIINRKKDGSLCEEETAISPVLDADGAITHFVAIRRDITGQKHLHHQINPAEKFSATPRKTARDISFEMHELREIVGSNTDIFYIYNREGNLVKWNRALEELTGLSPRELKLWPMKEFVYEGDHELTFQKMEEVFEKGHARVEARLLSRDGTFIPHLCNGYVLRDAHGTVTGFAGTGHDISERKRMEETLRQSEARYRELFENASDYVYTNDLAGVFTSVNRALCERTGYRAEELIGAPIGKLVSPACIEKARAMTEAKIKEGRSYTKYEIEIVAKNGEFIPIELNSRLIIENGKPTGVQGTGRDISERKRTQEKLKAAKDLAEAALLLKNKFVSLVSHDLNGPLSGLYGLLGLARNEAAGAGMNNLDGFLAVAHKTTGRMLDMVGTLLTAEQFKSGCIEPRPENVAMRDLVAMEFELLAPLASGKSVRLINAVPHDAVMSADPLLLAKVLQNLVSNAIKFCRPGDTITVFVPEGEKHTVAVADTGIGVKRSIIAKLFRHEEKTSTIGTGGETGTGLGLPLIFDIMKAHGGDVRVSSEEGKGATFFVVLPPPDNA